VLPARRALGSRVELLRRGLADPARAESKGTLGAAHTLWEQLIAPALGDLKGIKRVIVSPDGPLALIPFEALLASAPVEGQSPKPDAWLGSRWAVSYAFSAATLAARRGHGAGNAIVAVANADFGGALPPLPHTAAEAAALRDLAGKRLPTLEILEGANATRTRLLALPALPHASVLHIATHGEANEVEPERSGLWLAPDSTGGKPGFLSVADVSALKLDADLVTLSACETGLGRLERGEGVVGLTRAFVAAGARSVVVSLWKVNDQASADLMRQFYEGVLAKRLPRDEALARARRALLQSKATRAPFYWAPFVLVGEAGKIE
jgi:CHAT domain-containing protein